MRVLYAYKVFEPGRRVVTSVILKLACGHGVVQKPMDKVPTQIHCLSQCEEKHASPRIP
mgnify:CR=1 FL=1